MELMEVKVKPPGRRRSMTTGRRMADPPRRKLSTKELAKQIMNKAAGGKHRDELGAAPPPANATAAPPAAAKPPPKPKKMKALLRSFAGSACGIAPVKTDRVRRKGWTFIGASAKSGRKTGRCLHEKQTRGKADSKIGSRQCSYVFAKQNKAGQLVIALSEMCREKCSQHPRGPGTSVKRRAVGGPGICVTKCGKAPSFIKPKRAWSKASAKTLFDVLSCARPANNNRKKVGKATGRPVQKSPTKQPGKE